MNKRSCWVAVFLGLLLFADGAAEADSAREALKKGKTCFDRGEFDSAIAALTEAVRLNPEYAVAYFVRGSAYSRKNDLDKAIADCNEAIRLMNLVADDGLLQPLALAPHDLVLLPAELDGLRL
jgi:tetratricopeptide (TPR) repeat protein